MSAQDVGDPSDNSEGSAVRSGGTEAASEGGEDQRPVRVEPNEHEYECRIEVRIRIFGTRDQAVEQGAHVLRLLTDPYKDQLVSVELLDAVQMASGP